MQAVRRIDIEKETIEHPGLIDAGVLKAVGFWNGYNEERFINPILLVDEEWELENRDKIIVYLKGFPRINHQFGFSHCRFECNRAMFHDLGCAEQTDGIWIWPEGLAHYVEDHNIRLPSEFISTMKYNNFTIIQDVGYGMIDYGFWIGWCNKIKGAGKKSDGLVLNTRRRIK